MADNWFFDDDILRLEAQALVQSSRACSPQPVHDFRVLLLNDDLSMVLCFNSGRSRDFRLLTRSDVLHRCVWRAILKSASDGRGSGDHDNAFDSTESLVNPLSSSEAQTFTVSRTWFAREPGICEDGSHTVSGVSLAKEMKDSSRADLGDDEVPRYEETHIFTCKDYEKQVPQQIVFDAFGPGGLAVDEGGRYVSSNDKGKVTADRARHVHRLGRAQVRDLVCLGDEVRNSQNSGGACGICPRILRLKRLIEKLQCTDFGIGQAHGVHENVFSKGKGGWKGMKLLANILFFFPFFSQIKRN